MNDMANVLNSGVLAFFDPGALVIVLAGTALATTARCGWLDMGTAIRAFIGLTSANFDAHANRAALARSVPEIKRRGHLCADAPLPPDRATAAMVKAYLVSGSIEALHTAARAERSTREIVRGQAMRVFDYAGEQAPIFGLVGTLFAITQLNPAATSSTTEAMMGAVGTAVLSSLYGVLTAHLFCVPIAGAIERRGLREETARGELLDWFEAELSGENARAQAKALGKMTAKDQQVALAALQDAA